MRSFVIALSAGCAVAALATAAIAHSWYPHECCHDTDCAPVDSAVWVVPAGGGPKILRVTSRVGEALIPRDFPVRASQDGRMHICMSYDPFGAPALLCFFMPPIM